MFSSSILTCQFPGARQLWRAQTNPYLAQNLARADLPPPRKRHPSPLKVHCPP